MGKSFFTEIPGDMSTREEFDLSRWKCQLAGKGNDKFTMSSGIATVRSIRIPRSTRTHSLFSPLARTRFSIAAHGGPPTISLFLSLVKNPVLYHLRCSDGVYEKQTTYKVQNASLWSSKIAEAAQGKMGEVTYKASNPRTSRQSIRKHTHTPAHTLHTETHATWPLSKGR
jgi:hypothetical protein